MVLAIIISGQETFEREYSPLLQIRDALFCADTRSVFHDLIQVVRGDAKPIGIAPDGMILLEGMVY